MPYEEIRKGHFAEVALNNGSRLFSNKKCLLFETRLGWGAKHKTAKLSGLPVNLNPA